MPESFLCMRCYRNHSSLWRLIEHSFNSHKHPTIPLLCFFCKENFHLDSGKGTLILYNYTLSKHFNAQFQLHTSVVMSLIEKVVIFFFLYNVIVFYNKIFFQQFFCMF